jgi:hypothetical protein
MDAIHEINFYNNFDLISQTLKDHDPQVVQSLNEIAIYVASLHLECRENNTLIKSLKQECHESDIKVGMLSFKCEEYEEINS